MRLVGTIEKRSKDTYRLSVTVGYLPNGNPDRERRTVNAKNKTEANKLLAHFISELESNDYVRVSSRKVNEFFENEWKEYAADDLSPRTYQNYLDILEQRFLPVIGTKKLTDVKPYQISKIINNATRMDKKEGSLSTETKKIFLKAIVHLFKVAKDQHRLIKENPCDNVKINKPKSKEIKKTHEPYSTEEIYQLLSALVTEDIRNQLIILTALVTGARAGEIAGLEIKHFDFTNKTVTFEQKVIAVRNEGAILQDGLKVGDFKIVAVPETYLDMMASYIATLNDNWRDSGYDPEHKFIFGHLDGRPVTPKSFLRLWQRISKRHNLRQIRFHDFRHTAATLWVMNNVPIKTVQAMLGHKSFDTTSNRYSHATKEGKRIASNLMEDLLKS